MGIFDKLIGRSSEAPTIGIGERSSVPEHSPKSAGGEQPPQPVELHCSFCGKGRNDVRKLIAGPGVNICDECVLVCHDIIAADETARPASIDVSASEVPASAEETLAAIERKLRANHNPSLPLVSLKMKTTPIGNKIVWLYRTSYDGPELDSTAAEHLLAAALKPHGIKVSSGGYMGGGHGHEGEGSQLFNYTYTSSEHARFEAQVAELDKLDRRLAFNVPPNSPRRENYIS